jgi:Tol biopolymer transport system component
MSARNLLVRGSALLCGVALAAAAPPAPAQIVTQATDVRTVIAGPGALDDAGSFVFTGSTTNQLGGNPRHAPQVFRFDAVSGAATALTGEPRGVTALVSVSDDGQWLAFSSFADLVGDNHDRSLELFLRATDGSQTHQLTDDPAPNGGSVTQVALSGNGEWIAFVSNTDPLGQNPEQREQLFVIDRDGQNLRQLTTAASGTFGLITISDDGARIAFDHDGDLTGSNPDRSSELFAALADGTDLRQLTDAPGDRYASGPALSGNGQTIAFESDADLTGGNGDNHSEIFAIAWDGTGLRQLTDTRTALGVTGDPASQSPSITDDGQTVVFYSNHSTLFSNLDGNFEIYEVRSDGTGLSALTSSLLEAGSFLPVISGDGSRIAYLGVGAEIRLRVMNGDGNDDLALITYDLVFNEQPDVDAEGSLAVFRQTTDLIAGAGQLWRVERDGSPEQVTELSSGNANSPSLTGDGAWVLFSSTADPAGENGDGSEEIFRIRSSGADLEQVTSGPDGSDSRNPSVASDGTLIAFDGNGDPTGDNADGSREIFRTRLDGSELVQLTSGAGDTISRHPRVDGAGSWVVFESNADLVGLNADGGYEVFRVREDGTGLEQLTDSGSLYSRSPDVSDDGTRVVFSSTADPTGENPESNAEVFVFDDGTEQIRQLTSFGSGASVTPRVSGDGAWTYFVSDAPVFEDDPDRPVDRYRVPTAGGAVERVDALRAGRIGSVGPIGLGGSGGGLAVSADGSVAAFSTLGDITESNADQLPEIWWIDRGTPPRLQVGKASPTVLSWDHESGPARYDAIRGQVSDLAESGGGTTDLGPVICLEDDSPDADTEGFGDQEQPPPGQAFFFLYRGSPGVTQPGSYGSSSAGGEREPASGDCPR